MKTRLKTKEELQLEFGVTDYQVDDAGGVRINGKDMAITPVMYKLHMNDIIKQGYTICDWMITDKPISKVDQPTWDKLPQNENNYKIEMQNVWTSELMDSKHLSIQSGAALSQLHRDGWGYKINPVSYDYLNDLYSSEKSIPKSSEFNLIEFYSLKELLEKEPEICFDEDGDLFRNQSEKNGDVYFPLLGGFQLAFLGTVQKIELDDLQEIPSWVIRKNLGH